MVAGRNGGDDGGETGQDEIGAESRDHLDDDEHSDNTSGEIGAESRDQFGSSQLSDTW